jgi:hypothetical protein
MTLYLDRFEGDWAVLLLEEEAKEFLIPRSLLPPGTGEGEVLKLRLERDRSETRSRREEIERLREELKKPEKN